MNASSESGLCALVTRISDVVIVGVGIWCRSALDHGSVGDESRQIAPLREKVDAILGDVKAVTARVNSEAERVDHAIHGTIDRVDNTAEHLKSSVMDKVNNAAGIVRGVRAAIVSLLQTDHRPKPPATAAGRL